MTTYPIISSIVIALIALLHIYILILEMFLWDKPAGRKAFGHSQEMATLSKTLAANQGLYNGFLAAGLFWGLSQGAAGGRHQGLFSELHLGGRNLRRHYRKTQNSLHPSLARLHRFGAVISKSLISLLYPRPGLKRGLEKPTITR